MTDLVFEPLATRDGRWLLAELFTRYRRIAEVRLAKRDTEVVRRNLAGLEDAIAYVGSLPEDDDRLLSLNAWVERVGIDEWHASLADGGWWSDLYYNCTRFRAFGDEDVDEFITWVAGFYLSLPDTITDAPTTSTSMSLAIARGALYIDFEGRKSEPPLLLGLLMPTGDEGDTRFMQFVFDPMFRQAAEAKGASIATVEDTLALLTTIARRGQAVVAWSRHERDTIVKAGGEAAMSVQSRYRDARELARHWRREVRPDLQPETIPFSGRHRLAFYLDAIGYEVSTSHGPGNTGSRIQTVRAALESTGGQYDRLTRVQKAKWNTTGTTARACGRSVSRRPLNMRLQPTIVGDADEDRQLEHERPGIHEATRPSLDLPPG
jgi:hypothetical protein